MSETIAVGSNIEIIPDLPERLSEENEYSAPVVVRELVGKLEEGEPTFKQTALVGSFYCDDDRDDSMMIFITAHREGDPAAISHHYSGYGVALRMLTTIGQSESKPSLFVVDNSLASRDVVLENILHTGWGDYAYLSSTSYAFTEGTQYNYQLKYLDNGGLQFYVWPSTGVAPVTPTIENGAYSNIQSSGNFYGVSCSNTGGYQAVFPSMSLANLDPSYALLYCRLDGVDMPSEFSAVASAWAGKSDFSSLGIYMRVYNHLLEGWDAVKFDHHAFGAGSSPSIRLEIDGLLRSEHLSPVDLCADILLISEDTSDFASGVDAALSVDDAYLEAYSTDVVHIGGDTDAWIHDSNGLDYLTFDITNISTKEWMLSSNPKISGSFWLPIMIIKEIEDLGTGLPLVPVTDWVSVVHKEDWRFSAREENYLSFRSGLIGLNVRVKFYTFSNIQAADALLLSQLDKPTAYDIMARARIPNEVFLAVDVVASMTATEVMALIDNFIAMEQRATLSMTDINIYLQSVDGISDANVTALSALKHELSGTVTAVPAVNGVLTLGDAYVEQFATLNDATHLNVTVS